MHIVIAVLAGLLVGSVGATILSKRIADEIALAHLELSRLILRIHVAIAKLEAKL